MKHQNLPVVTSECARIRRTAKPSGGIRQSQGLTRILLMLAIVCAPSYSNTQTASALNAEVQSAPATPVAAGRNVNVHVSAACPPAGIPGAQPAAKGKATGHHKVFLSWNSGSQPSRRTGPIDGYCVYRSKDPKAAQQTACAQCERVSPVAVLGTGCVDDVVEDGATYYYVVTALKGNLMSAPSNETEALIPNSPKPNPARSQSVPALSCRGKWAQDKHP